MGTEIRDKPYPGFWIKTNGVITYFEEIKQVSVSDNYLRILLCEGNEPLKIEFSSPNKALKCMDYIFDCIRDRVCFIDIKCFSTEEEPVPEAKQTESGSLSWTIGCPFCGGETKFEWPAVIPGIAQMPCRLRCGCTAYIFHPSYGSHDV